MSKISGWLDIWGNTAIKLSFKRANYKIILKCSNLNYKVDKNGQNCVKVIINPYIYTYTYVLN